MNIERDCLERDAGRCFKCGEVVLGQPHSCHHRLLRSGGGPDGLDNRIILCGSGTTGCHGEVHHNPAHSYRDGYLVSRYGNPAIVPVRHWDLGLVWLTPDGGVVTEAERNARGGEEA